MRRVLWLSLLVFCLVAPARGQTEGQFLPAGTLLQCTLDEPRLSSRTVEIGETRIQLRLLEDLDTSLQASTRIPRPAESKLIPETPRSLYPGYSFNLLGTNIARSDTGAVIQMVGSGSFAPPEKTIAANGSFRQLNSDGSVAATGTWEATNFLSFVPFGGLNRGLLGGVLELTVTLVPVAGALQTGVPMSVTCLLNPPRGFTGEEGITIGFFINKVRGKTAFHMSL